MADDSGQLAITVSVDDDLLARAQSIGDEPTPDATVTAALEEYIARHGQPRIIEHFHQFTWDPGFDNKESRRRRDRKLDLID